MSTSEDRDRIDDREDTTDDVEGHGMGDYVEYQGDAPSEGMERTDDPDVEGHAMTGAITPHISPAPSEAPSE